MPERKPTGLITQTDRAFLCSKYRKKNHAHHPKPIPTTPHHRSRHTQTGQPTTYPTGFNSSPDPEFIPSCEALEDHGGCYEMLFVPGDGEDAIEIFIPKDGVDTKLLAFSPRQSNSDSKSIQKTKSVCLNTTPCNIFCKSVIVYFCAVN